MKTYLIILEITLLSLSLNASRNRFCNKFNSSDPIVITYNKPGDKPYILRDSVIEWYPMFGLYDFSHFNNFILPDGPISYRTDPSKSIKGKVIKNLLENLLKEIKERKTSYKDFIILKSKGFNIKKRAGLLVVKCKKYPFVIKIFIENPRSFIRPYNKGFDPAAQFVVGGGITRHALGFSRIKNALQVRKRIEENPYLESTVDVPRKWFWMPQKKEYFYIKGYNFEENPITSKVPAVYAVIADAIEIERTFSLTSDHDKSLALELSALLNYTIDPHINNFVVEKGSKKTVIIDTEHFPTLVGYKEKPQISSYFSYYRDLAWKYLKDRYGRLKYERKRLRTQKITPFHTL